MKPGKKRNEAIEIIMDLTSRQTDDWTHSWPNQWLQWPQDPLTKKLSGPRNNTGLLKRSKHPTKPKSAPDDLIEDTQYAMSMRRCLMITEELADYPGKRLARSQAQLKIARSSPRFLEKRGRHHIIRQHWLRNDLKLSRILPCVLLQRPR